jgi:hypothetical protein
VSKRLDDGRSEQFVAASAEVEYRIQFYVAIDTLSRELIEYFNQPGIAVFKAMSDTLSSAVVDVPVLSRHPEFNLTSLRIQLAMFRNEHQYTSLTDDAAYLRSMTPEVRQFFSQVEALVRLMLVMPAT